MTGNSKNNQSNEAAKRLLTVEKVRKIKGSEWSNMRGSESSKCEQVQVANNS